MNLLCPDYVNLLCRSLDELAPAFAGMDQARRERGPIGIARAVDMSTDARPVEDLVRASLPTVDRRLVRTEGMRTRILAAARSRAPALCVGAKYSGMAGNRRVTPQTIPVPSHLAAAPLLPPQASDAYFGPPSSCLTVGSKVNFDW